MERLIKDLLEYSRITGQRRPFRLVDSEMTLQHVLDNLKRCIDQSHAIITHDAMPTLMADETQFMQVLQNLIGNSLKFCNSTQTPRIHIGASRRQQDWLFYVKDNGIGIEKQYHEKVFTIFQRLHTRQEYPGNGIGLTIVKRIVERHGGAVWLESSPDQGSTFFFAIRDQDKKA